MKQNKFNSSLTINVWIYLTIFSLLILGFLWLFQIVFLKQYYEYFKKQSIIQSASEINKSYELKGITGLEDLAHDYGVCIEIVSNNTTIYKSNMFNKGCLTSNTSYSYIEDFIKSNELSKIYSVKNLRYSNKTIIYASKGTDNTYTFVSASLEPLDATTDILKSQFINVSVIVLLLSFLIAYYISRRISKPIIKITEKAKKMGEGNYDIKFDEHGSIREINNLAKTLNYTKDELSKIEELRTDLLANVSHDLKTPLTMIKAYAEMVRDITYNNKEKREANLNVIIEESDRLNILVNDILTLSKLQQNETKLEIEKFDLNELINNIINRYDILKEEGYNLVYNYNKKLIINADKKRIEQVIYNLVNNAINYTGDDKTVTINVKDNKNNYRIEIIDTGKGIKKEDLPFIWDKYYHSNKKHKRNVIGTGLGLSIVKNILNSHNYTYGVDSKENVGSNFYFEIPKNDKKDKKIS